MVPFGTRHDYNGTHKATAFPLGNSVYRRSWRPNPGRARDPRVGPREGVRSRQSGDVRFGNELGVAACEAVGSQHGSPRFRFLQPPRRAPSKKSSATRFLFQRWTRVFLSPSLEMLACPIRRLARESSPPRRLPAMWAPPIPDLGARLHSFPPSSIQEPNQHRRLYSRSWPSRIPQ